MPPDTDHKGLANKIEMLGPLQLPDPNSTQVNINGPLWRSVLEATLSSEKHQLREYALKEVCSFLQYGSRESLPRFKLFWQSVMAKTLVKKKSLTFFI